MKNERFKLIDLDALCLRQPQNDEMSATHKSRLIFQMVRTACAPVQQLRPKAQGNTHGLVVSMKRPASAPLYPAGWDRPLIEQCEGGMGESRRGRTLREGEKTIRTGR